MLKKLVGYLGLAAVLWAAFSVFTVRSSDPRITMAVDTARVSGRKFTGIAYDFYPNRYPSYLGLFWNGKKTGTEYQWYPDGGLWVQDEFRDGVPHGESKIWYPDGKVKRLAHFDRGERTGEYFGWHPNGQLSDYNFYEGKREVTHKSWISDGVPFYNYVYQNGRKVGMRGGDFCKLLRPWES